MDETTCQERLVAMSKNIELLHAQYNQVQAFKERHERVPAAIQLSTARLLQTIHEANKKMRQTHEPYTPACALRYGTPATSESKLSSPPTSQHSSPNSHNSHNTEKRPPRSRSSTKWDFVLNGMTKGMDRRGSFNKNPLSRKLAKKFKVLQQDVRHRQRQLVHSS